MKSRIRHISKIFVASMAILLVLLLCCQDEGDVEIEGDDAGECSDGADNDLDGLFDCDDSGCEGSPDCAGDDDTGDDDAGDDDASDDDSAGDDDAGDDDAGDDDTSTDDADGDGWSPADGDCDDGDPDVHPEAQEVCDGDDEDCDGVIDEEDADGCTTYYADVDGDSFGDPDDGACLCAPDATHVLEDGSDCYDANADANPDQTAYFDTERGDGSFDYNCDGNEEFAWTQQFVCTPGICMLIHEGWVNGVPACGVTDSWGTGCSGTGNCTETMISRTQECR